MTPHTSTITLAIMAFWTLSFCACGAAWPKYRIEIGKLAEVGTMSKLIQEMKTLEKARGKRSVYLKGPGITAIHVYFNKISGIYRCEFLVGYCRIKDFDANNETLESNQWQNLPEEGEFAEVLELAGLPWFLATVQSVDLLWATESYKRVKTEAGKVFEDEVLEVRNFVTVKIEGQEIGVMISKLLKSYFRAYEPKEMVAASRN